jgi:hypothetical protein
VTKDAAQRRSWTFYEAILIEKRIMPYLTFSLEQAERIVQPKAKTSPPLSLVHSTASNTFSLHFWDWIITVCTEGMAGGAALPLAHQNTFP